MNVWFYIWWFMLAIFANIIVGGIYWYCKSRIKSDPEYKQRFMHRYNVYKYVWIGYAVIGMILLILFPFK